MEQASDALSRLVLLMQAGGERGVIASLAPKKCRGSEKSLYIHSYLFYLGDESVTWLNGQSDLAGLRMWKSGN